MLKTAFNINPVQQQAFNDWSKWLVGAAAVGGGARAALGLGSMVNRNLSAPARPPAPMIVDVPYKVRPEEEEEDEVPPIKKAEGPHGDLLPWLFGSEARTPADIPLKMPAYGFGVPGAAIAGWKGVGAGLKWMRQRELQKDLDEAKDDLYKSELGKYRPAELSKLSADCRAIINGEKPQDEQWQKVASALDRLAAVSRAKRASFEWKDLLPWNMPVLNKLPWQDAAGAYGLYAPLAAAGSGSLAYNYARHLDPERRKAKAIQDQMDEAERNQAPSMMARLVPVDQGGSPIQRHALKAIKKEEPERLAPGSVKESAARPDLEVKAREFVAKLLGRS